MMDESVDIPADKKDDTSVAGDKSEQAKKAESPKQASEPKVVEKLEVNDAEMKAQEGDPAQVGSSLL